MSEHTHNPRRLFLKQAAIAAVVLPFAGRALMANAQDLPKLDPADPTAQALGYVEDASKVDTAKYPNFKPEQTCANCQFATGTGEWLPCQLFPGKSVAAKGWCSAWAAKA